MSEACRDLRKDGVRVKERDPTRYVTCWSEKEVFDGERCKAFVLILRTSGCRWARESGCSFCGYITDSAPEVGAEELGKQFQSALERYKGEPVFKIYTSGSFIDDQEIPSEFQEEVFKVLKDKGVRRLVIETLPRFATEEKVKWALDMFSGNGRSIELALGLESATPEVLRHSINKPSKVQDFRKACDLIRGLGGRTRIYIVIKPPLLSEREALEDAVLSAEAVKDWADTISFNPINVQRGTMVERLWRRREYQPPWLWTVVEVLRRTSGLGPRVVSGPSGGGTRRGAHNCGKCDKKVLKAIERFSSEGKAEVGILDGPRCDCIDLWKDQLDLEDHVHGPFVVERRSRR